MPCSCVPKVIANLVSNYCICGALGMGTTSSSRVKSEKRKSTASVRPDLVVFLRAKEGVTEAIPGAELMRASSGYGKYSEHLFASEPLAGSEHYLDLAGRVTVLPVRTDRTTLPMSLETKDADDTRLGRIKIPSLREPGTTNARGVLHHASQVVAVEWCSFAWTTRKKRDPRVS